MFHLSDADYLSYLLERVEENIFPENNHSSYKQKYSNKKSLLEKKRMIVLLIS